MTFVLIYVAQGSFKRVALFTVYIYSFEQVSVYMYNLHPAMKIKNVWGNIKNIKRSCVLHLPSNTYNRFSIQNELKESNYNTSLSGKEYYFHSQGENDCLRYKVIIHLVKKCLLHYKKMSKHSHIFKKFEFFFNVNTEL